MIAKAITKIALLDDDKSFLDSIELYLKTKLPYNVQIESFYNPKDLISYVKNECFLADSPSTILDAFYTNEISIESIKAALYDLSKVKALLVVDQNLNNADLSGTDVINQLLCYYPALKITLLTSVINPEQAIELHNSNIIDVFINKENSNSIEKLEATLIKQVKSTIDEFQYDLEDAFPNTILNTSKTYEIKKNKVLELEVYKAYLTTSPNGDLAILNTQDEVKFFKYNKKEEAFISNDIN